MRSKRVVFFCNSTVSAVNVLQFFDRTKFNRKIYHFYFFYCNIPLNGPILTEHSSLVAIKTTYLSIILINNPDKNRILSI